MKKNILRELFIGILFCGSASGTQQAYLGNIWQNCWLAIAKQQAVLPIPQNVNSNDLKVIFELTNTGDKNNTLLHHAVFVNNSAAVKALLEYGSPLDRQNITGATPLYIALLNMTKQQAYQENAERLIFWGASIEIVKQYYNYFDKWLDEKAQLRNNFIAWAGGSMQQMFSFLQASGGNLAVVKSLNGFEIMSTLEAKNKELNKVNDSIKEVDNKDKEVDNKDKEALKNLANKQLLLNKEISQLIYLCNVFFQVHDAQRGTLLHVAADAGKIGVIKALLATDALLNLPISGRPWIDEQDISGDTALIKAVKKNDEEIVGFLLMYSADRTIRNRQGKTAFDIAKEQKKQNILFLFNPPSEVYEYSPQPSFEIKKSKKFKKDEEKELEKAYEKKTFIRVTKEEENAPETILQGWEEYINFALSSQNKKPDYYFPKGADGTRPREMTYLHAAVIDGDMQTAKKFVTKDKNTLYLQDNLQSKKLPIHYAAAQGRLDFVKYFVKQAAELATIKDSFDKNALMYAVGSGNDELVAYLVEKMGKINQKELIDLSGVSVLQKAIVITIPESLEKNRVKIVEILCKAFPVLVTLQDKFGQMPLYYAIENNKYSSVKALLQNGAIMYVCDTKNAQSLIHFAIMKAIDYPTEKDRCKIISALCKKFKKWVNGNQGVQSSFTTFVTPLFLAVVYRVGGNLLTLGKKPVVQKVVPGVVLVDVDAVRVKIVKRLLKRGADPLIKSYVQPRGGGALQMQMPLDVVKPPSEIASILQKAVEANKQLFIDFVKALSSLL